MKSGEVLGETKNGGQTGIDQGYALEKDFRDRADGTMIKNYYMQHPWVHKLLPGEEEELFGKLQGLFGASTVREVPTGYVRSRESYEELFDRTREIMTEDEYYLHRSAEDSSSEEDQKVNIKIYNNLNWPTKWGSKAVEGGGGMARRPGSYQKGGSHGGRVWPNLVGEGRGLEGAVGGGSHFVGHWSRPGRQERPRGERQGACAGCPCQRCLDRCLSTSGLLVLPFLCGQSSIKMGGGYVVVSGSRELDTRARPRAERRRNALRLAKKVVRRSKAVRKSGRGNTKRRGWRRLRQWNYKGGRRRKAGR